MVHLVKSCETVEVNTESREQQQFRHSRLVDLEPRYSRLVAFTTINININISIDVSVDIVSSINIFNTNATNSVCIKQRNLHDGKPYLCRYYNLIERANQVQSSSKMSTLGRGLPPAAPSKSAHPREPSGGAFTMFTPQQVKQFKEAFNMIDQDGDGRVTEGDLKVMLSNLGKCLVERRGI